MFYKQIQFKEDSRYIFEASLANNMRLRLLSEADFDKLLDTDIDGIFSVLAEKKYDISNKEQEVVLNKAEDSLLQTVLQFSKNETLKEYFILPRDFFNLKLLYKGWLKEEKYENLKFLKNGLLSEEQLRALYNGESTEVLHPILAGAIKQFDNEISEQSPFEIDILWDKYLHQFYLSQSNALDNDFMQKLHSLKIDLANILNLFRLKAFDKDYKVYQKVFIEGGQSSLYDFSDLYKEDMDIIVGKLSYLDYAESLKKGLEGYRKTSFLTEMEKELENYFLNYLNHAANRIFNFEVIVAYYWLKKNEINNLRLLLTAKSNAIDKNWILDRLRVL